MKGSCRPNAQDTNRAVLTADESFYEINWTTMECKASLHARVTATEKARLSDATPTKSLIETLRTRTGREASLELKPSSAQILPRLLKSLALGHRTRRPASIATPCRRRVIIEAKVVQWQLCDLPWPLDPSQLPTTMRLPAVPCTLAIISTNPASN